MHGEHARDAGLHLAVSETFHGISNFMSVITNYADFVISGLDQRTQARSRSGRRSVGTPRRSCWAEERSTAFSKQVLALRGDGKWRTRRSRAN